MRLLLIGALVAIPTLASAQRTTTAATKRDPKAMTVDDSPKGPTLRVRDVEDLSPVKLLIDKRKDLKLTDAQVSALKTSESELKDKNAPYFHAVDSLIGEMRPPLNPTDESRSRMQRAMGTLANTMDMIAASYDPMIKATLATLDPEQQAKATELMEKQKREGDARIREKLGMRGRGREP